MSPSGEDARGVDEAMAQMWRVNPLVSPLQMVTASDGSCALPEDKAHCHGAETQHMDGTAECVSHSSCEAPGSGHHAHVHPCEREINFLYTHRCIRCR